MELLSTLTENSDLFEKGFVGTLTLTGLSAVLALVLGVVLAAFRVSPVPPLRAFGAAWVTVFRNTPLTVLFFVAVLALPKLHVTLSFYQFAVLTLGCYTAAFICEAVRSGINTVPVGQAEAARSLGLSFRQTLGSVVLPQAGRAVIGPIGSLLIALTKNSAIAGSFSVMELYSVQFTLTENGYLIWWTFVWIALGYLIITLGLSAFFRFLERHLGVPK